MNALTTLLSFAHLVGLVLAVGAATVKVSLLVGCRTQPALVPVYLEVARPITRQIIAGLILLTVSGIGWLLYGYSLTPLLVVKICLVAAIWVLGPIIDNVFEPRFRKLAPAAGEPGSADFIRAQNQYLTLEVTATAMFFVVIGVWVLA